MRKIKSFKVICLMATVIGFGSCGNNSEKNVTKEVLHMDNLKAMKDTLKEDSDDLLQNKVIMIVEPSDIKLSLASKVKLVLENNTSESLSLGQQFSIEFYNKISWEKLPVTDRILFEDIAYNISPGQTKELTINLKHKPFNYKSGRYRISKHIMVIPSKQELDLTAEFRIR